MLGNIHIKGKDEIIETVISIIYNIMYSISIKESNVMDVFWKFTIFENLILTPFE